MITADLKEKKDALEGIISELSAEHIGLTSGKGKSELKKNIKEFDEENELYILQELDILKKTTETKANDILVLMSNYHVAPGLLRTKYMKNKIKEDSEVLSSLMYNLVLSDLTIKKLFIKIQNGTATFRDTESFSRIQTAHFDLKKNYLQVKALFETQYQMLNMEYNNKQKMIEGVTGNGPGSIELESPETLIRLEPILPENKVDKNTMNFDQRSLIKKLQDARENKDV